MCVLFKRFYKYRFVDCRWVQPKKKRQEYKILFLFESKKTNKIGDSNIIIGKARY